MLCLRTPVTENRNNQWPWHLYYSCCYYCSDKFGCGMCREHTNFVNCVRFSPDGSKFITVSSDKKGRIYDGKTAETIGELSSEDAHQGSIYAVSWSPDSKRVGLFLL